MNKIIHQPLFSLLKQKHCQPFVNLSAFQRSPLRLKRQLVVKLKEAPMSLKHLNQNFLTNSLIKNKLNKKDVSE